MSGDVLLRARHGRAGRRPAGARVRALLGELFPQAPGNVPRERSQRMLSVGVQAAAVCVAAVALLARVSGIPAWNSIYAEDYGIYLVQALQHPWHVFIPYAGYLQLIPRLIAQVAAMVPLTAAAAVFAVAGAFIAAGCALFSYHASAGFIRSRGLRAVLAAALILLPIAPLEVAGDTVNSPWYMLAALFWAVLWRPRTRAGMAVAAVVAFAASSADPLAIVYVPLLIMRAVALPRIREHAVTAGWLAGLAVQVPAIRQSYVQHRQRVRKLASLRKSVAYYFHTVVLRALGWHLSWHLVSLAGQNGATLIVGTFLAVVLGWAMITQGRQVRLFAVTAVVFGFVYTLACAVINGYVVYETPLLGPVAFEPGSRYSLVPIVLLDAAAIVAVDAFLRRRGKAAPAADAPGQARSHVQPHHPEPHHPQHPQPQPHHPQPQAIFAVAALVGVLAIGWVTDYRYVTQRTTDGYWTPVATRYLDECQHSRTGKIRIPEWGKPPKVTVSCSNLHR